MSVRVDVQKPALDRLQERIISACGECRKIRRFCDSCESKFLRERRVLVSALPVAKVQFLGNGHTIGELIVRELDPVSGTASKDLQLYKEVLSPYFEFSGAVIEKGLSLLFSGTNSVGKTTAAVWIALKYLEQGHSVYYVTFPSLHRTHTQTYSKIEEVQDVATGLLEEMLSVDLLIVDELGKETVHSESVRYLADTYLKTREEQLRPTILITNMPVDALGKKPEAGGYGASFWNMLSERYRFFLFNPSGENLRTNHRASWPW